MLKTQQKIVIIVAISIALLIQLKHFNSSNVNSQTHLIEEERKLRDYNDLSIIIGTRNDNYGLNPILRLRFTLQNLLLFEWKRRYNLFVQIIIVEWNPIIENHHIWQNKEIQDLLTDNSLKKHHTEIVFYSIPSYYNDKANCFKEKPNLYCPYFEYHAKNVGIRRSNGKWKIFQNMDDLFSINLLNLLGYYISNNLFHQNAIYQAAKKHIQISSLIESYLYNISLIRVGITPNANISKECIGDSNDCIINLNSSLENGIFGSLKPSSGDFILIHNYNLYNYFGGSFVEICGSIHLDSEFVMRQIYVNKLIPYYILPKWSYFHIDHFKQRVRRNDNRTYDHIGKKNISDNIKIQCDQAAVDTYQGIKRVKKLSNNTYWSRVYKETNTNWGIKHVNFMPCYYCVFSQFCVNKTQICLS